MQTSYGFGPYAAGLTDRDASVRILISRGRRYGRPGDAMALQCVGHEPAGFHVFHVVRENLRSFFATGARAAHRLLNDHEVTWKKAQATQACRVRLELLLHAGSHLGLFGQEVLHDRWGTRRPHDARLPQLAREEKVIGASLPNHDALSCEIDLIEAGQRRVIADGIAALDEHVCRGETNAFTSLRIDRKESDVGLLLRHCID